MGTSDHPARQRSRWPYVSLVPLGFGAWAPIYAGTKARQTLWTLLGVLWTVMVIVGFVLANTPGHHNSGAAGALIVIGWVGSIATSFAIRDAYDERMASGLLTAAERGEQRLRDRERAREIAARNPALAREMGIGRPDRPGAVHSGVIDVNNASVTALLTLPGVDGQLATKIIETREQLDGFSSVEDLGETLDLDGAQVERLRGSAIFLPRD